MKKEIIRREGYVLRLSPYKDADMMVTAIDKNGLFSFLARGIRKMTSKNASACQILSYSSFSLAASADLQSLSLTEAAVVRPRPDQEQLDVLSAASFLAEVTLRFSEEDGGAENYPYLDAAVKALTSGYSPFATCLLYLAPVLHHLGYGLNVDSCVNCGSKTGIVAVSFEEGGYLCENCVGPETPHLPVRDLKILRYAFRYQPSDFVRVEFDKEECMRLLSLLVQYAENFTGVRLKSIALLLKC